MLICLAVLGFAFGGTAQSTSPASLTLSKTDSVYLSKISTSTLTNKLNTPEKEWAWELIKQRGELETNWLLLSAVYDNYKEYREPLITHLKNRALIEKSPNALEALQYVYSIEGNRPELIDVIIAASSDNENLKEMYSFNYLSRTIIVEKMLASKRYSDEDLFWVLHSTSFGYDSRYVLGLLLNNQTPGKAWAQAFAEFQKFRPDLVAYAVEKFNGKISFEAAEYLLTHRAEFHAFHFDSLYDVTLTSLWNATKESLGDDLEPEFLVSIATNTSLPQSVIDESVEIGVSRCCYEKCLFVNKLTETLKDGLGQWCRVNASKSSREKLIPQLNERRLAELVSYVNYFVGNSKRKPAEYYQHKMNYKNRQKYQSEVLADLNEVSYN